MEFRCISKFYKNLEKISWGDWFFHFIAVSTWVISSCDYKVLKVKNVIIITDFSINISSGHCCKKIYLNLQISRSEYEDFVEKLRNRKPASYGDFYLGSNERYLHYIDSWVMEVSANKYYMIEINDDLVDAFDGLLDFRLVNTYDK